VGFWHASGMPLGSAIEAVVLSASAHGGFPTLPERRRASVSNSKFS
jgi:hypothetical protein